MRCDFYPLWYENGALRAWLAVGGLRLAVSEEKRTTRSDIESDRIPPFSSPLIVNRQPLTTREARRIRRERIRNYSGGFG